MRMLKLKYVITVGKLKGMMYRGRPRETFLNSLASWHGGTSATKFIDSAGDRMAICAH